MVHDLLLSGSVPVGPVERPGPQRRGQPRFPAMEKPEGLDGGRIRDGAQRPESCSIVLVFVSLSYPARDIRIL